MLNKGTCPVPASDKWGYNAPWVLFSKSQWKRGGGVCCMEERFVGRLLPLVSLPLIVLPPPCLFLEMLWFDLQARGFESAHVRTKKVFRFVYTHLIWTYFVCSWFVCICLWTYLFAHVLFAYVWTYLFAHDLLHMFMNIFVCSCEVRVWDGSAFILWRCGS